MIYTNILDLIGNTPLVKLGAIFPQKDIADIYIKLEGTNLSGSIKDRAAIGMIERAEKAGVLVESGTLVEPTSGNTGIALAMIGAIKGYRVIIVMPETASIERRSILKAYGAELILTDGAMGMVGAIEVATVLINENPNYIMLEQFDNAANPDKHSATTAVEIYEDLPTLDAFVAGIGTAGTITGVGRYLKAKNKAIKIIGMEPLQSAVLTTGVAGKHRIQGVGAGFIPGNYDADVVDEILCVDDADAIAFSQLLARKQGLFVGISTGGNLVAAYEMAKRLGKGKIVVTISPDGGEKYLSTDLVK
ncbi:cysteine synthase A [Erysipelotrichaceae bacterium]|nr:cysteine synthase A [Erysipelotrichaceae bacterium]